MDFIEIVGNRKFPRFCVHLSGRYFSDSQKAGWKECTIIEISRKGMLIKCPSDEKIPAGSTICLEVYIPRQLDPVNVKGTVKWVRQTDDNLLSGIELCKLLDENLFSQLG